MMRLGFMAAAVSLVALSASTRALADESDVAEQLFREGHLLLKEQRYAEACPKFAESELHDKASGTLLALAYCQELATLFASAHANYVAAAELARTESQAERERAATERAAALTGRLSTLTVAVPEALWVLPGLRVTSNGVDLARTAWGRPIPSDGGAFDIEVSASNRKPWSSQVVIAAERDQRVVAVPVLAEAEPSALGQLGPRSAPPVTPAPPAPERTYWTPPRVVGWAAIGTGAVAGIAAIYFTASAKSAETDVQNTLRAEQAAPASARIPWDASGHTREEDGRRAQGLAQGFGVASGALLLGGAALVIFGAQKRDHESPSVSLGVLPGLAQVNYARAF